MNPQNAFDFWCAMRRQCLPGAAWLTVALAAALLAGCVTPIGTSRTGADVVYRKVSTSALAGRLSDNALEVMRRYDLVAGWKSNPDEALRRLHDQACADERRDLLYVLAELNYQRGLQLHHSVKPGQARRAPDYFLTSAIYAWFFLFGDGPEPAPSAFDGRFRVACHLYNRALARGFAAGPSTHSSVRPQTGSRALAPGVVRILPGDDAFTNKLASIDELLPADELLVRGLSVRNRRSGMGAPLVSLSRPKNDRQGYDRCAAETLLLRTSGDVRAWSRGELVVTLELHSGSESESVQVGARTVPLEMDLTAPVARGLDDSRIWDLGASQFFSGLQRVKTDLYTMEPYQPGRIPVVFVHGTFSSPVWWAEMINTLNADPGLRERFQFWYFIYNSGNPVTYSAASLRAAIEQKLRQFDPDGTNAALRQMVVVGHSQGGLLAKLTAVDTGSRLWNAASNKDFETLPIPAAERDQLRRCIFFQPLPGVQRVVFISTPHRGSYRNSLFVQRLLRRFMTLPSEVVRSAGSLLTVLEPPDVPKELRRKVPTSLDGMSVSNKVILTLAEIPVASGVKAHSIIAVRGEGPPEQGSDGVVKYSSAHQNYTESEFIVRSGHSCQDKPATIEEVRRILHEHLRPGKP